MTQIVTVAISPTADCLELERTLFERAHLDEKRVTIAANTRENAAAARSRLHFVSSRYRQAPSGSDGTNVPGMGSTLTLTSYAPDEDATNHLQGTGIPRHGVFYYNIAVEEGRLVVVYKGPPDEQNDVEQTLRAHGLRRVRSFPVELPD